MNADIIRTKPRAYCTFSAERYMGHSPSICARYAGLTMLHRCTSAGIIATAATVRSGAYDVALKAINPDFQVFSQGCPKLVPLIESNHILPGDALIEEAAAEYLAPLKAEGVDVVILGCTHYPLISQVVANYMGEGVALIDSGAESAKAIIKTLTETGGLAETDAKAEVNYYCSARLNDFETIAQVFLNKDIHGSAFEINIEEY